MHVHRSHRAAAAVVVAAVLALPPFPAPGAAGPIDRASAEAGVTSGSDPDGARGETVVLRGRLVCLAEEMRRLYGVPIPPVHDHLLGLRLEKEPEAGGLRYYTILRTTFAKALFEDPRYHDHLMVLSGRVFPGTALLEVTRFRWIRDGKEYELYYWCDVCSIKTLDPGPCACCQGKVEFRERPVADDRDSGR